MGVIAVRLVDGNEQRINVPQHEIVIEPFYERVNQNIVENVDLEEIRSVSQKRPVGRLPSLVGNIVSSDRVFCINIIERSIYRGAEYLTFLFRSSSHE